MISVVIPLYNKEKTVVRALRSVLDQTYQHFEIVVIDDGSSDRGAGEVVSLRDPRIRLFHQPNAGVSAARNRGIHEATGDLVAFLDADDEWLPGFLETIDGMRRRHPDSEVFASCYYIQRRGEPRMLPIWRGLAAGLSEVTLDDYFALAAASDPPICSSAVAVSKRALAAVGFFPLGITSGEDLLTWARLASRFKVALNLSPLSVFHQDLSRGRGLPSREPDSDDRVAAGLLELLPRLAGERRRSLRRYLGMWHKMRASMYLRLGRRRSALIETLKSLRHRPADWKSYACAAGCLLPTSVVLCGFATLGARRSSSLRSEAAR